MSLSRFAVPAVAGLVLSGCSGAGATIPEPGASTSPEVVASTSPTTTSVTGPRDETLTVEPAAALESAVRTYSTYFFTGAGIGAWDLWSTGCRASNDQAEVVRTIVAFAELTGKSDNPMTEFSVVSIDGSSARVTYDFAVGDYGQTAQPWVLEASGWRYDAC